MTGVSTDISASFVKPSGRPGDILYAKASLIGMGTINLVSWFSWFLILMILGKSLAYTRVDFFNPTGELVAYGSEYLTTFGFQHTE